MAKIDIGSVAGIDEALRFLQDGLSEESIQAKLDAVFGPLLKEAADTANEIYGEKATAVVDASKYPEYRIKATSDGETIAFVEFGAGLTTDGSGEFAARAPFNVEEGSYSVSQNPMGMYARTGFRYWYYDGKRMNAVEARPGMEAARQYVADNWERAVKEVFRFD